MAEVKAKDGQNPKWVRCDLGDIFRNDSLQKLMDDILAHHEVTFTEDTSVPPPYDFPDFGASRLQPAALKHVCSELGRYLDRAVAPVTDIPSVMILQRRAIVWERVIQACQQQIYSDSNLRRVFAALKKGEEECEEKGKRGKEEGKKEDASNVEQSSEKLSGNQILVEVGVKAGLSVVFSLLKQAWAQVAWQKQFEEQMKASGVVVPFTTVNLPNEVLKSVLEVMKGVPPLSLSNMKSLSHLGTSCLQQAFEFLSWVVQPESYVDAEGKRLATEILFNLALQHGSLNYLIEWVENALSCLVSYTGREDVVRPSLSLGFCGTALEEIRKRSHIGVQVDSVDHAPFEPQQLNTDGSVSLLEFALFLCQQLATVSQNCTRYFSQGGETEGEEERFLSETCEVHAFGSNSSSQLAMGSTEKLVTAMSLPHMANCQVIEAGQYCSFVIYTDGTMKACGKGSYGRLGLGTSDTQTTMKGVNTFPPGTLLRKIASSRGSDGHSLAITAEGQVYSWGDGNYGKLGHGDNATQKLPKLIAAFAGKVVRNVACGNRHTAAVTMDGELYTWGEGDYGRLGHGSTSTQKTPTKVQNIGPVRQVACGAAHTLALAMDGVTVWSFGSGDSGKLGHGDTNRQTVPKVIEGLRGMICQKVCAASQFSLVLTAPGKVYSFGNGSGVGKGTTEPRQYTPWMVEALEGEMIIDISTGDGHCLALTQRGEVYAWGTNSMGQCGQGHSNGSITTPSKVKGLDGVQVQQISAGTSHSIVWTAVPVDRRASAMWHWPYCVSVSEKTFERLLSLLTQYGSISGEHPLPPFTSKESQECFLFSVLSLTRTHLSLVAPLGPSCVHMACGSQVKPLRTLLFKLIDSQVPPALDQVTSEALEVGSSVLLPPILDRLDLLLSILPEDPSLLTSLTTGQRRQLDILLSGFQERGELAGLLVDEEWMGDTGEGWVSAPHVKKLFGLCDRMVDYLHEATLAFLESPSPPSSSSDDLRLGSPLLLTFQQFLLSTYLNVATMMKSNLEWAELSDHLSLPLNDQLSLLEHFELFYNLLKEHSLPVLRAVASRAREKEDPAAFLSSVHDVVFGFLAHDFPNHIALTIHQVPAFDIAFSVDDLFMELAKAVHALVVMLPSSLVEEMEGEELQCEPNDEMLDKVNVEKLRGVVTHPWRELADFQRLLCLAAAKSTEFFYTSTTVTAEHHKQDQNQVLGYTPKKGKLSLLSSHLLSNGVVGDSSETAEAIYTWVSLCKTLPNIPKRDSEKGEEGGGKETDVWSNYLIDYNELRKQKDAQNHLDLLLEPVDIKPCDPAGATTLLALAVGGAGNKQAEMIYNNMMELARCRDWNTCSDEDALPQLRRVSCAALACLLKHTGLSLYATNCGTKPKKKLVDVYRAVFGLRREVFTNRPLPDFEGIMEEEARRKFEEKCNGICATLFFLTCVLNPAMPEESEPIVPQISTSTPTGSSTSDDVAIRSPGSSAHHPSGSKSPQRLFSHPEVKDDSSSVSPKPEPSVLHSASHVVASAPMHGWSLAAVKQALSHHRWQKDRMDMHASQESLHQKITGIVVDIVSIVFQEEEVLDRKELLYVLMSQQQRAMHRLRALQKVIQFVKEMQEGGDDFLLPSSRLIFLSCCIAHDVHYSDNITAAPSILQHEIKSLSHTLLQQMVARLHSVDPKHLPESTILGLQRELLLALQWINFQHDPSDLQLLFTGYLYPKMVALAGVVSTRVLPEVVKATHSHLEDRVRTACTLVMQLLGLRVGMNAEVLQSRPDILATVSEHLFGQLEGYLSITNMANALVSKWEVMGRDVVEVRESRMGDFLCFVNTLSATHKAIRAVLASDMWFGTLLKIVDINPDTGVPVVVSLKTRLLALQVLGAIMAELSENSSSLDHTKCTKIIEDLLELMYRCMFLAPVSHFQDNLKPSPTDKNLGQTVVLPFSLDSAHQHGCTVTVEGECVVVEGSGVDGYSLGQLSLSSGKYSWKVSVECPNAAFCVGVSQKPLTNRQVGSSGQFWAWEGHTGRLYHEGESNELLFIAKEGDSVTVEYDTVAKTLSFRKNDGGLNVAFHNVVKQGRDLYPVLLFTRRHNTTKVKLHPITHISHSPLAHLHRQEQLTSGYPLLSPTGITLTQAVVSLIYQLQEKEPWQSAITQVVCSKLGEMDVLIHRLLDVQAELETPQDASPPSDPILPALSLLMKQFTQIVWPCLAVIGGLDSGFYLGRECRTESKGEVVTATVVTIPDSEQRVEIQDQVTPTTAQVKKRSVSLSSLKLLTQKNFSLSLILDHLTPSILINLAHLAGYLDAKHSLLSILQQAHGSARSFPQVISKSLPYHQLCESVLQMAATKSLHTILFNESVVQLLNYHPPSIDVVVAGGYMDKSELARTVCDVLKCIVGRAINPSPLKPTLKLLELERVHAVLTYECLASTAEYVYHHGQPLVETKQGAVSTGGNVSSASSSPPPTPTSNSPPVVPLVGGPPPPPPIFPTPMGGGRRENGAQAPTPPMVHVLADMGFSRAQINVAIDKCEIPPNTGEESRMQLLVSWIIDHPDAVSEEEARLERLRVEQEEEEERRRREEQQQQQQEADQNAAASEFLSLFGEMFDPSHAPTSPMEEGDAVDGEERERDTKHAPDLLEGPSINSEVPDVSLSGMDTSPQSLKTLLSALGLSQRRPTPRRFEFSNTDPLGEHLYRRERESGVEREGEEEGDGGAEEDIPEGVGVVKMSHTCDELVQQAQKLRSLGENFTAINRITAATQTLVARHVTMLVITTLSTQTKQNFISGLKALDLVDVKSLVRLLRLVHAGRIDGTPGKVFSVKTPSSLLPIKGLECLGSAITAVVTESHSAGLQLMHACARDLLAAAVGGAELLQKGTRRRRRPHRRGHVERTPQFDWKEKSDLSTLSNPNFSVSQNLVQMMADVSGKMLLGNGTSVATSDGVLQITDALAACLFSSKLEPQHRFWGLEQLLKMFSSTSKDQLARMNPQDLMAPSQLEHLTGHKGQIMGCVENKREKKLVSIGEDNTLLLWDMQAAQPETLSLPFPTPSSSSSSPPSSPGLLLPVLAQSSNHTCVAGALNSTLCIWRVKDGKTVSETLPELITALQWKISQKDGEVPLLAVGLLDGQLVLAEVLRASVNLSPELQLTRLEHWLKGAVCCISWSPTGSLFAVASTSHCVQVYCGSGREYVPATEIKELQVTSMCWSPEGSYLTTLEEDGIMKLWNVSSDTPTIIHSFDTHPTCCMTWHNIVDDSGKMLLASGSQDGTVHLWTVQGKEPTDGSYEDASPIDQSDSSVGVEHVTSCHGHAAPITMLVFCESAVLLASGCKAGAVRVWDLWSGSLLKFATRAVGEVIHLAWTSHGLTVCYKNTSTLCLLPPGPGDYLGERCIHSCLPTLHLHTITDPSKAPCLTALLKNLHHVLLDQYQYEEGELCSAHQLVHSQYLQLLTALAVGLGLNSVLISPPYPPHFDPPPPAKEWQWLSDFTRAVKMSEMLNKRLPLPKDCGFSLPKDVQPLDSSEKYKPTDNTVWTLPMDVQILEWVVQKPEDWWLSTRSTVYTWGKGSWHQLGHSTRERVLPTAVEEWQDVRQIVAGSYCTYAVRFDGSVASVGEGSYGRLGHGGSENETILKNVSALQGIPVIQVVAGPRVSTSTDEGFALALTDTGMVYSWGKGYKGRLGHTTAENVRSPKLVEALAGKDIKMLASCDYHCAAVTTSGDLYTFGSKENGKLGRGRDSPSGSIGHVTQITRFLDSDEQTEWEDVKIGCVSCGQTFTLAISDDGSQVFAFGKADNAAFGTRGVTGDHFYPMLLNHLTPFGPFVKSSSGNRVSALINTRGQLCWFGKLSDSGTIVEAEFMSFLSEEKVVDAQTASQYILALTKSGDVYSWGKNTGSTCELGYEASSIQTTPKLVERLSEKGIKQISAGVRHAAASNSTLPERGVTSIAIPSSIPTQYSALKDLPRPAIHARLLLLNYYSKLMLSSWRLFSLQTSTQTEVSQFHINPLSDSSTRSLISPLHVEGMITSVVNRTMVTKSHGPSITVQRITQDDRASRPVFPQISSQILQKTPSELRCPSRAWKVNLVGEGADDAGGVFDETIAQMCEELEGGVVKLLISTPNAKNKCGFNTDRFVFDPTCTSPKDMKHFRFLGILFGVAMRTKKPLDLHLAQPMWKLLAGMTLTSEDLEEVDLMFMQMLYSIRDVHKGGIREEEFSEMIPIESFECQSMTGNFVPIVPGGSNIKLTYQNRKEYVEKALNFRLHELDHQVAAVREGMSSIVPLPLLSLYTAKMVETAVCGYERVDIHMLKKVVRYRDGITERDQLVQWLWQTLDLFTNEEKILFLRFVSGRSRLPTRVSEIPQRFQVMKGQSTDGLPTSQTCFFQLRLPNYPSQELLAERLRYAIRNCRSIDMDNYMLRRNSSHSDLVDYDSEDDEWY